MTITDRQQLAYIAGQAADARLNLELETEGMVLNIGPQHPATHGTLRVIVRLDGEQVVAAEPVMGYMHRGYEKLTEVRTYPQVTTLINRIDWLGSFANEVPFILAAEKLMEVEAPPRAQWIRTILFELSRIANITLFLGDMAAQLGALTPVFYAFRDREYILNQIEAVTGGRFHPNFDRIGGLKDDLPKGWGEETKGALRKLSEFCDIMENLVLGNEIFAARTRGIGVIPADVAQAYGLSGANLRASGVDFDLRRDNPVGLVYDKVDWKVWTHPDGDSFARYWVRLQETREAIAIVEKLLDGIPAGPVMAKVPRIIKVPAGEAWVETENPLGAMGYYIVSKGDLTPFRVKIRSASFNNVGAARRLRPRRDHHPRQPVLHPWGYRPMILGVELAYWQVTILKIVLGMTAVLLPAGTLVYAYLFKAVSFMQSRLGPMEAGPYGSMQLLAEVGKFLQKEDIVPTKADRLLFKLAPYVVLVSTFLLVLVVPFSVDDTFLNLDTGIYFAMAVSSVSVIGILMAGWASANKYSLMGGIRAAGQLIAYELPMILAIVGVVIQAGTLNMNGIVSAQWHGEIFGWGGIGNPYIVIGPLVMMGKMMIVAFLVVWARFSFPRFREDQLQRLAWKFLIPISLINIAATAVLKVVF